MFQELTKERVQEGYIQIAMVQERNFGGWFVWLVFLSTLPWLLTFCYLCFQVPSRWKEGRADRILPHLNEKSLATVFTQLQKQRLVQK